MLASLVFRLMQLCRFLTFALKTVFEKALIKTKETVNNASHKLSKNVCLEKINSVVW
jgi:hypothetical protein